MSFLAAVRQGLKALGLSTRFVNLGTVALVVVCAAVAMVGLRSWALRDAPLTADENSYVFQANLFARGRLKHPFPGCTHAFYHEMIVLDAQKGWFSRYQPGHPLWLTPGVWLRSPHAMVVLGGVLTLVLAGLTAARLGVPPGAVALMFVLAAASIRFDRHEALRLRDSTADYARLRDAVSSAPPNAVVMANSSKHRYTGLAHGQLVFNPQGLGSQPIVSRVDSAADEVFIRRLFAGRPLLFLNLHRNVLVPLPEGTDPMEWVASLDKVECDTGTAVVSERHVTAFSATAKSDAAGWLARGVRRGLTPGDYTLEVEVETGRGPGMAGKLFVRDASADEGVDLAWANIPSQGTISTSSVPFRVEHVLEVEVRVWFAATNDLTLRRVAVRDHDIPDAVRLAP